MCVCVCACRHSHALTHTCTHTLTKVLHRLGADEATMWDYSHPPASGLGKCPGWPSFFTAVNTRSCWLHVMDAEAAQGWRYQFVVRLRPDVSYKPTLRFAEWPLWDHSNKQQVWAPCKCGKGRAAKRGKMVHDVLYRDQAIQGFPQEAGEKSETKRNAQICQVKSGRWFSILKISPWLRFYGQCPVPSLSRSFRALSSLRQGPRIFKYDRRRKSDCL